MDFTASTSGLRLWCNRSGSPRNLTLDTEHARKRQRINILKCNCGFTLVAVYVIPTFEDPNNPFAPKLRNAADRYTPELLEVKFIRHPALCTTMDVVPLTLNHYCSIGVQVPCLKKSLTQWIIYFR